MREGRQGRTEAAAVQAACREGPTMEVEGRARKERTEKMNAMSVTLEVSRLSGWLNADAPCRVERGKHRRRVTCGQAGGRAGRGVQWRKQQEGPDCGG